MSQFNNVFCEHFPFWEKLTDLQREYLIKNTKIHKFNKGTTIHDPDKDGGVLVIKQGVLRVYMISQDEKELTLMRFHKDDLCLLSASCVTTPVAIELFIDAEEDCECVFINNTAFEKINNECSCAKIYALENVVDCVSYMLWIMEQILFMSMDKRLAIFLLDEISRTNTDIVMLTHSLIAKYMGCAREVASRMLKYFENEGIVELSRRGVRILDKNKLRALATKKA